jgi:hypothetical protein
LSCARLKHCDQKGQLLLAFFSSLRFDRTVFVRAPATDANND